MAQDYARKTARKPNRNRAAATPKKKPKAGPRPDSRQPARRSVAKVQHGGLSLKWILSLAAIGGFVGFIGYLNSLPAPEQTDAPASAPEQTDSGKESAVTGRDENRPGFRFYDMLPDSEVVPPQVDEYTPGPGQATSDYLVQTGSFRTRADAERQRAQIAFQGLRAYVSRIDMEGGGTWFRVNVGPFNSRSQMNSAVDKLVSINIQPLVRRIPRENPGEG